MIQLVEDGEVETIILKDMSRLGRDYLVVGQLREFFRKKGVRLIAINEIMTVTMEMTISLYSGML